MTYRYLLGAAAAIALPAVAAAATITFDDVPAPYLFANAHPLTGQYNPADGILFGGHGAILNSVADFGVTGFSGPNVLAYADVGQAGGSYRTFGTFDTICFSVPQTAVMFDVGSGDGALLFDVKTYSADGTVLSDTVVTLGSALQTISLDGGFTSLAYGLVGAGNGDSFVIDNLSFTAGPAIPAPEPIAAAMMAVGAGVLGRRRRRG